MDIVYIVSCDNALLTTLHMSSTKEGYQNKLLSNEPWHMFRSYERPIIVDRSNNNFWQAPSVVSTLTTITAHSVVIILIRRVYAHAENTTSWPSVVLIPGQRRRWWTNIGSFTPCIVIPWPDAGLRRRPNINSSLSQCIAFAAYSAALAWDQKLPLPSVMENNINKDVE